MMGHSRVLVLCLAALLLGCGQSQNATQTAAPPPSPPAQTSSTMSSTSARTNAETGLTRIVAMSWSHGDRYSAVPSLRLRSGDGTETVRGLAVAFGEERVGEDEVLDPDGDGAVPSEVLDEETVRVFTEAGVPGAALKRRLRIVPTRVVPLSEVEIGPGGQGVGARAATGAVARGVAFLFPDSALRFLREVGPSAVQVEIRGTHLVDTNGRAVDAEFVRGELPTGDRPAGSDAGVQGGTFESWFSVDGN